MLYNHQLESIERMRLIESTPFINNGQHHSTRVGLLANKVGSGKTFTVLEFVLQNPRPTTEHYTQIIGCENGFVTSRSYPCMNKTLVVADSKLIPQWEEEIVKHGLAFNHIVISANEHINNITDKHDIVLCTHTRYDAVTMFYAAQTWSRVIIDEPGELKLPNTNPCTQFTWLLSATLSLNDVTKTKISTKLIYGMNLDMYRYIRVRIADADVVESMKLPATNVIKHETVENALINTIITKKQLVYDFMRAGDMASAKRALAGNTIGHENIYELFMDHVLRKISYNENSQLNGAGARVRKWESIRIRMELMLQRIMDEPCVACKTRNASIITTCCNYVLCDICNDNCPICDVKSGVCTNRAKVISLLTKSTENQRFLVYSSSNESFVLIRSICDEHGIKYIDKVQGLMSVRSRLIKSYKKGDVRVMFMSSTSDASGLNLQETTDIIIYHSMHDSAITQIIGRANRMGRTIGPLSVHYV